MGSDEVVLLEQAEEDLLRGRRSYERQLKGLGGYFWQSLLSDLEALKIYAGVHERVYGLHRMMSKRFPYAIYYEVSDNLAYVVAVLPMRRNPKWILKTLNKR